MSLATDKKRWDDLHAAYAKAQDALSEYDRQLHSHYGRYEKSWLKAAQRKKLESLQERVDKIGDKIVELIKKISPRDWMSGVPAYWIRSELTWEDAIRPKGEPLSVTPPTAWGHDRPIQEAPMHKVQARRLSNSEVDGERYATDQLQSDYFMDWVRGQLAEAARMDPTDVLPLETKADARVIAKNMLQQLEEDTKRELHESAEFFKGFRKILDGAQDWLADELLRLKGEMRGGVREAPIQRVPGELRKNVDPSAWYVDGYVGDELVHTIGPFSSKRDATQASRDRRLRSLVDKLEWGDPYQGMDMGHALAPEPLSDRTRRSRVAAGSAPISDPEYIIQGLYNDGTGGGGFAEHGFDDEAVAIAEAQKIARSNWFEGDYVRVITRDGELVWDSRGKGGMREPRHRAAERMYHVIAINERTGKKTYLTRTPVTHQEALTILRKQRPHRDVRKQLEPA